MKHSPLLAALAISLGVHGAILIFPEEVDDVRPAPEKTTEVGLVYIAPPTTPLPQPVPAPALPKPVPSPAPPEKIATPQKGPATESPRRTAPKNNIPKRVAADAPSPVEAPSPPSQTMTTATHPAKVPATETAPASEPPPAEPRGQSLHQPGETIPVAAAPPVAKTFQPPRYRFAPKPEYPGLATRRRWQGEVLLRALVDAQGEVIRVALESSSGHDILDQAALKTARRWKFHPAHDGRENVPQEVCLPIRFELSKQ